MEGRARNGAERSSGLGSERSELRSLERRLPKSGALRNVHVHAASGVVAPDALSGTESVVIEHRLGEVAKRRMGPPVVVANEPFPHPRPPLRP